MTYVYRVPGTNLWFSDNSITEAQHFVLPKEFSSNSFSVICIFFAHIVCLSDIREELVACTLRGKKVFSAEFFMAIKLD